MSSRWAARIALVEGAALAELRADAAILAAVVGDTLWIRGEGPEAPLEAALRKVPGLVRHHLLDGDRLVPTGLRTPTARLPATTWRPLSELLSPLAPAAAMPAPIPAAVPIRLLRSGLERAAEALLVEFSAFATYCEHAPLVRLTPLSFAVAADGRALILGSPLPPLRGRPLTNLGGVLVPCGFAWDPPVDAASVRAVCGAVAETVLLLAEVGSCEIIRDADFVRVTRAAVRATQESTRG